jgi:lipoprotein-anchoring transpeptidase ErfK/SrfK
VNGQINPFLEQISRRDFLKFSLVGFLSLAFPSRASASLPPSPLLGRVAEEVVDIFEQPTFSSQKIKTLWRDSLLPLKGAVQGSGDPPHNRTWYELEAGGYTHSGGIQPVRIQINPPGRQIPDEGQLAEVTVPYSDAVWWRTSQGAVAYRLYYATTYWVKGIKEDEAGIPYYEIYDNKLKKSYHTLARHLRLVPPEELTPISSHIDPSTKKITVSLSDQLVIASEAGRPVFMARAATGARFSNGDFSTPKGPHSVLYKSPSHHMMAGDPEAANSFDLPGVPWICYITENGLAFHGTYWHNDFGKPRSHGCINLSPQAARWLYRWTHPVVPPGVQLSFAGPGGGPGTQVEIY